ncbi:hypothetical protein AKJ09_05938 [Labilithrix luteola]|uniref:PpiC domain-containing protein n=1 Tax=Labilithrix luteola TaxID=1391654 RepID=A0A0K1Q1K0_9BACT|nr:hypothetical protein [Labilithrix luteola]AKU99274.1 hypothetical protein AKJ09_05938 [Labilithrix luteola]
MAHLRTLQDIGRHRLTHFFAIGAVLYALAPKEPERGAIAVDAARVEAALRATQANRGHSLSPEEKQDVVASVVDEEVLFREGIRLGLEEGDGIVRGRVADRMRAQLEKSVPDPSLEDADIDVELEKRRAGPELVHVALYFVSKDHAGAEKRAERLSKELAEAADGGAAPAVDPTPLPADAWWTADTLAQAAGASVAQGALTTPIGRASQPISAAWGYYVVVPLERRAPDEAELRASARAAVLARKKAAEVQRAVDRARKEYRVDVRVPEGIPAIEGRHARARGPGGGVD